MNAKMWLGLICVFVSSILLSEVERYDLTAPWNLAVGSWAAISLCIGWWAPIVSDGEGP